MVIQVDFNCTSFNGQALTWMRMENIVDVDEWSMVALYLRKVTRPL